MTTHTALRERVENGEFVFGTMVLELHNPSLPAILASAGFDFFVVDMEHGRHSVGDAADLFATARLAGITPLVRPPSHAPEHPKRLLGLGAAGVMVPNVETAEQAEAIVQSVKYPPEGTRGFSGMPVQVDFEPMSVADMAQRVNESLFVMAQIESQTGVDNAADIFGVAGIHAVLIGPADLSLNLGLQGEYEHPAFVEAVQRVFAAAQQNGVAPGIHCPTLEMARQWREAGASILTHSSDVGLLTSVVRGAGEALAALR